MKTFLEILRIVPDFYTLTKKIIGEKTIYMIGIPRDFDKDVMIPQNEIFPLEEVLELAKVNAKSAKRLIPETIMHKRNITLRKRLISFIATEYTLFLLKQHLVKDYINDFPLFEIESVRFNDTALIEEVIPINSTRMSRQKSKEENNKGLKLDSSSLTSCFLKAKTDNEKTKKGKQSARFLNKEMEAIPRLIESIKSVCNEKKSKCIPVEEIISKLVERDDELIVTQGTS